MAASELDALFAEARDALGNGSYDEARSLYRRAIDAAPNSADAHYGLATCCFMLGQHDAARSHFQKVTELDPLRATAFINLGALHNRLGQQDEAIACLRKGLKIDPRRAEGYYNLGIAYRQKGLPDLAIQAYREATRVNPRMVDAFLNLGNVLFESERFQEAITAYKQALDARPDFEKALHGLRNAEKRLAEMTPVAKPRIPLSEAASTADLIDVVGAEPAHAFANVVERADAMAWLKEACDKQEGNCQEILRVLEKELGPSSRDLSRSLVGNPAVGELEMHLDAFVAALGTLRTARKALDDGMARVLELGRKFAAAAHSQGEPVH